MKNRISCVLIKVYFKPVYNFCCLASGTQKTVSLFFAETFSRLYKKNTAGQKPSVIAAIAEIYFLSSIFYSTKSKINPLKNEINLYPAFGNIIIGNR